MLSPAACTVGFKSCVVSLWPALRAGALTTRGTGALALRCLGLEFGEAESSLGDIQFLPSLQNWDLEAGG